MRIYLDLPSRVSAFTRWMGWPEVAREQSKNKGVVCLWKNGATTSLREEHFGTVGDVSNVSNEYLFTLATATRPTSDVSMHDSCVRHAPGNKRGRGER